MFNRYKPLIEDRTLVHRLDGFIGALAALEHDVTEALGNVGMHVSDQINVLDAKTAENLADHVLGNTTRQTCHVDVAIVFETDFSPIAFLIKTLGQRWFLFAVPVFPFC